ncbi:MAG: diguanylate cyclase (GGDEF)-like protein/PAS domain S-box-containing protein [Oceanicoccus sp.]|jgi:diguanylate cyclase (GGDEF)-like protein/PAS domain S-box-containing protein
MTKSKKPLEFAPHVAARSPMRHKVLLIVGLFIMANMTLMGLGYLQSETLNSVRAFVRGEGLWSKAQKDAAFYLERYIQSRKYSDFQQFKKSLEVNLGDSEARLALQENPPNRDRAEKGFLKGANHPDDVDNMMDFFVLFQDVYYLRVAIEIWTQGDHKIQELISLGDHIRHCITQKNDICLNENMIHLEKLNQELHDIGTNFSLILSDGARWVKSTFLVVSAIIISLQFLLIYIITRRFILELNRNEEELLVSEKRFLSLYQSNVIGMIEWDLDGNILAANDAYLSMIGYSQTDLLNGKVNWKTLTPKEYEQADINAADEILKYGICTPFQKDFIHNDGHRVAVYLGATLLHGETAKGIAFVIDQSLQKLSETKLKLSAKVFDASNDGIIITDKYKHVLAVNPAYCKSTGVKKDEFLGCTPPILAAQNMSETLYAEITEKLLQNDHWQGDAFDTTASGTSIPVLLSINAVRDKQYKISHYVINIKDIREQKNAEEQLKKLAHFDYLTGLANRSLYQDRLSQALIRAKRHSSRCALLFFDLDDFKPINDQYGHEIGDLALQVVASRLKQQVRDNDTIARLGGDEFVIIIEDLNTTADAANLAQKIIASLSKPVQLKDHTLHLGCSVGISIYPDNADDTLTLTRNADIAMYAAKATGSNQYYFYSPSFKS